MTTPMSEDGGPLREWAPLATLLQRIPAKVQSGLFTQDVIFTCIDALPEFIAVGTNHGIVYWYDRKTGDLERLRCENLNSTITCLKVVSTVDYMVAAGNDQGIVTVFQIPKQAPASLPEILKPKQKKQVERYNIIGLHKQNVTAVEWSKNGEKLFSGDEGGLVVLTGIDFSMHVSKSYELLNEKYSIIQLSYRHRLLLISSLFRTIIVDQDDDNRVSQIGQKERKSLGRLGAVFGSQLSQSQEPVIYASRPGLRLWQANKDGTVTKTLVFKDAVKTHQQEVELLNPAPENPKKIRGEPSFGVILSFFEDLLITYSADIIYVVNPATIAITSLVTDLRHVSCVACTKDEIFVLEGERNIIRIAYHPDSSTFASESVGYGIVRYEPLDILIEVMTSPEVQRLLKTSNSGNAVWATVAKKCSRKGLSFDKDARKKVRLMWLYLCRIVNNDILSESFAGKLSNAVKARHALRIEEMLRKGMCLNVLYDEDNELETSETQIIFDEKLYEVKSSKLSQMLSQVFKNEVQVDMMDAHRWRKEGERMDQVESLMAEQATKWELVANMLLNKFEHAA